MYSKRFCTDTKSLKDKFQLKNGYTSSDRISFSIEVSQCVPIITFKGFDSISSCKSPSEIGDFLNKIYFTSYMLEENVEFGNVKNVGQRPILSNDKYD